MKSKTLLCGVLLLLSHLSTAQTTSDSLSSGPPIYRIGLAGTIGSQRLQSITLQFDYFGPKRRIGFSFAYSPAWSIRHDWSQEFLRTDFHGHQVDLGFYQPTQKKLLWSDRSTVGLSWQVGYHYLDFKKIQYPYRGDRVRIRTSNIPYLIETKGWMFTSSFLFDTRLQYDLAPRTQFDIRLSFGFQSHSTDTGEIFSWRPDRPSLMNPGAGVMFTRVGLLRTLTNRR